MGGAYQPQPLLAQPQLLPRLASWLDAPSPAAAPPAEGVLGKPPSQTPSSLGSGNGSGSGSGNGNGSGAEAASRGNEAADAHGTCALCWETWTCASSSHGSPAYLWAAHGSSPWDGGASGPSPGCWGESTPSPETWTPNASSSSSCSHDTHVRSCQGFLSGTGTSADLGPMSPSSSPCSCPWPSSAWPARGCWSGRWKTSEPWPWPGASWHDLHPPVVTLTGSSCPRSGRRSGSGSSCAPGGWPVVSCLSLCHGS